jgi:GntR family transcriptional repressor for pyruvate dehydrogenase complex
VNTARDVELLPASVDVRPARIAGPPAYQVLADDLRAQITSGRLRPGDRLPTEPQLCAQSGLSRSTVREALRLLSSQHLIVTTRGVTGGSFVAEPSAHKIAETLEGGLGLLVANGMLAGGHLFELRFMLEVPAAELAAVRRTEAHLTELAAAMFDPDNDDVDTILTANRAFHTAMSAAAGNPLFRLVTQPLYAVANERELAVLAPKTFWAEVDSDHREILAAVIDQDGARAAAATRAHLERLQRAADHAMLRL